MAGVGYSHDQCLWEVRERGWAEGAGWRPCSQSKGVCWCEACVGLGWPFSTGPHRSRRMRTLACLWVRASPARGLTWRGTAPSGQGQFWEGLGSEHLCPTLLVAEGWVTLGLKPAFGHWAGVTRRSPVPVLECSCHVLGSWPHRLLRGPKDSPSG